jgi:hypothetical protein
MSNGQNAHASCINDFMPKNTSNPDFKF